VAELAVPPAMIMLLAPFAAMPCVRLQRMIVLPPAVVTFPSLAQDPPGTVLRVVVAAFAHSCATPFEEVQM
jgi:hypothetical protein